MEALGAIAEQALADDHRGRLRGRRQRALRAAHRRPRQPRRVRVLPQQADDDGRGRHDHDRRRRARRAAALARQPGPLRLGRLARARQARLQLPHGRALGGRRPGADRAPRRDPRRARRGRRALRRPARRRSTGVTLPAPTAPGDVRSWFVYVVRLDEAHRPRRRHGRAAGARRGLQAVPARGAPAAVLPQPRAPARASSRSPRPWRARRSRCRSTPASPPTTRPTSPPASPTCSS